ncbi:MAG: protein kinase domain-containing protein [Candidatus Binataceae bacterium]
MNAGEALSAGHLLDGRYRVKKVLGTGGMGRVYLSNDTRLANRPVAVKEMVVGGGIQEKKAIEDFTREANVLARLSHPGIPTLIDNFAENGRHYLVMEFVAGGDLQGMLDQLGSKARVPEEQALRWARQMLEVLDFLHGQNPPIIYRDLKPGNIMIGKDGRAMLIDFGIARFLPPGGRGTQIGSLGYAPPEQYAGRVEPRSDLYSLAATMHHLLTGRDPQLEPPFSFPPLSSLAPEVSPRTAETVMRALERDPAKRPASAKAMLRELPEPPPLARGSNANSAGSRGLAPEAATMRTAVLPGAYPAAAAQSSTMPTIVLTEPVAPRAARGASAAELIAPPIKRALELGGKLGSKALQLIERQLNSRGLGSAPLPAAASASSTARTKTLIRPPAMPSAPFPTDSPISAGLGRPASAAPAKLVSRGGTVEFGIFGPRTVIGRALNSTDEIDIDLKGLPHADGHVSRRHAEIIKRGADYFLRDLGSKNGTFIAGRGKLGRDQLYKLKNRDQVVLGGAILEFRRG